ncbi:hypothetical protein FSARC_3252 [Fusarium sarcochroum]|uniref:DUF7703 domain-containing protein n=1 Tax=Fusarium sarcochroum TaxID=1208366 RepID=A0A8H4U4J8_9HYPO|nr:hypothetical protein FSARC_3252 [Fusarium sarcochroum]
MPLPRRSDAMSRITSDGNYTPEAIMVITCATISIYNGIELLALIFTSSRRHNDLYYWSLAVAAFGLLPYATGWLIRYLDVIGDIADMLINDIGWILLTTGQALVLYSRLHLIVKSATVLWFVKWMIIANAVVWHCTITVLLFTVSPQRKHDYDGAYVRVQKAQLTFFCVQNFILSGFYIWKTTEIIRKKIAEHQTRRIIWQLLGINVLIVLIDITLLVVCFTNNFLWQQGIKAVFYSVKLKLEFAILGKLGDFVHKRGELISSDSKSTPMFGFVEMEPEPPPKTDGRANSIAAAGSIYLDKIRKASTGTSAAGPSGDQASVHNGTVVDKGKGVLRHTLDKGKNSDMGDVCDSGVQGSK